MLNEELASRKHEIVEDFHRVYYDSFETTWETTTWRGVKVLKNPHDLWMYQEVIWETRPDVIVECGTAYGGSALFFADLMDLMGRGVVYTIDTAGPSLFPNRPDHDRIVYVKGSSTDPQIWNMLTRGSEGMRVMVVLDSAHGCDHVLKELELWHRTVTPGCYLVVEDTNVNGRPVAAEHGPGPAEALERWLPEHPEFQVDAGRERYLLTFNSGGWLRRM